MKNIEHDNLPVFWDKILQNYACRYTWKQGESLEIKHHRNYLIPSLIHEDLLHLKNCMQELIKQGYFTVGVNGYFYGLTQKGFDLIMYYEFV